MQNCLVWGKRPTHLGTKSVREKCSVWVVQERQREQCRFSFHYLQNHQGLFRKEDCKASPQREAMTLYCNKHFRWVLINQEFGEACPGVVTVRYRGYEPHVAIKIQFKNSVSQLHWLYFKCSTATCGQWHPSWTVWVYPLSSHIPGDERSSFIH